MTRIAAIAMAGLALTAPACGGSTGGRIAQTGSKASAPTDGGLAFSRCMRSHGVTEFPDPDTSGQLQKVALKQLGVSSSRFAAAQSACRYLLQPTKAQVRQTLSGLLDFAHCMRSRGLPNWPDPMTERDGQAAFDLHGRINPDSPQVETISSKCAHLLHPPPSQNGTVLCNGVGEAGCHHYG